MASCARALRAVAATAVRRDFLRYLGMMTVRRMCRTGVSLRGGGRLHRHQAGLGDRIEPAKHEQAEEQAPPAAYK